MTLRLIGSLDFQLHDNLHEFVTEPEREAFLAKLQETEDWLYEDGEDETKGVYIAKLEELKKVCFSHLVCFSAYIRRQTDTWQNNCSKVTQLNNVTRSTQNEVPLLIK